MEKARFAGILSAGHSALLPPVILICCHLGPTEKVANLPSGAKGRFSCNSVYSGVIDEWATMQGCLLRLDGVHLHRRVLAALVILLGGMYEFWRTGRVTGLELFSWDRIREISN
jgi:hypothetical protein